MVSWVSLFEQPWTSVLRLFEHRSTVSSGNDCRLPLDGNSEAAFDPTLDVSSTEIDISNGTTEEDRSTTSVGIFSRPQQLPPRRKTLNVGQPSYRVCVGNTHDTDGFGFGDATEQFISPVVDQAVVDVFFGSTSCTKSCNTCDSPVSSSSGVG